MNGKLNKKINHILDTFIKNPLGYNVVLLNYKKLLSRNEDV